MSIDEDDKRFYIGKSTISGAGKGLFTKVPLAKGERLEVIGVLILADSTADVCTHYTNKYKFRMGDKLLIPLGYGGIANHANTPNVEKIIDGDKIYLQALRAIDNNEEIVYIYGEVGQSFIKKC